MITENFDIPANCKIPRKVSCYVQMTECKDGMYNFHVKVSVMNNTGRWFGTTVMIVRGVTDDDKPLELRKNLRLLAEARLCK